jgi:hypothetical protein
MFIMINHSIHTYAFYKILLFKILDKFFTIHKRIPQEGWMLAKDFMY